MSSEEDVIASSGVGISVFRENRIWLSTYCNKPACQG